MVSNPAKHHIFLVNFKSSHPDIFCNNAALKTFTATQNKHPWKLKFEQPVLKFERGFGFNNDS